MIACTFRIIRIGAHPHSVVTFPDGRQVLSKVIREHLGLSESRWRTRRRESTDPAYLLAPKVRDRKAGTPLAEDWRAVLDALPEFELPNQSSRRVAGWGWT